MGYHQAGFQVVGIDIHPRPNYPFRFWQADALEFLHEYLSTRGSLYDQFDAIHASPPCQLYSKTQRIRQRQHPDLVEPTRRLLEQTGLPWVIENVPGAPLNEPVVLEGQMFEGLRTQRSRWFETNWPLKVPFLRSPRPAPNAKMGRKAKAHEWIHIVGNAHSPNENRAAMGIDWHMTRAELSEAIPPAYTHYIGQQLLDHLKNGEPS